MEGTAISPVSVFQCEPMVEAILDHLVVGVQPLCVASVSSRSVGDDSTSSEIQLPQERVGG